MGFGVHQSSSNRTYVGSGSIASSGVLRDLVTEQIGFFKVDNKGVGIPDKIVSNPTIQSAPIFKLGVGRAPFSAQESIQVKASKMPFITQQFFGKNILSWKGTKADPSVSTEIYTIGYDGVDASKTLKGFDDHRDLVFQLRLWGNPVRKLTGVSKEILRQYVISSSCLDSCRDACEATPSLAGDIIADELIKQINADKFNSVYISNLVRVSKLRKTAEEETPIEGGITGAEYTLQVIDDGSNSALGAVQSQYSGVKVQRIGYTNITSTYKLWKEGTAPTAFANRLPISLAVCDTCPTGFTLTPASNVVTIQRSVLPTTDLSTPAARQTYANTIGTAYGDAVKSVTALAGVAGSGYTNGTFPLVFTGGGGSGAAGTVTIVGGVITARTITSGGSGYTTAPTVTFSAGAGTLGTVVATIAAPSVTSTFISNANGIATVNISSVAALPTNALVSDIIISSETSSPFCTPPAATNVAWIKGTETTRIPKEYSLTLGDDICGKDRLKEIQGAYPELVISIETSNDCATVYKTTVYSDPELDEECVTPTYKFTAPSPFLWNANWVEFKGILDTPVCEVEEVEKPCVAVGVMFETAAFYHNFSECLYGYYDYHLDDTDPVYMDISSHTNDWTASPCYKTDQILTKLRGTKFPTGSGRLIRQQEKSTLQYHGLEWTSNPGHNEAYGVVFSSKMDRFYDTYQLTIGSENSQNHVLGHTGNPSEITFTFAFPSGTGKEFEKLINGYVASLNNPLIGQVVL